MYINILCVYIRNWKEERSEILFCFDNYVVTVKTIFKFVIKHWINNNSDYVMKSI